MSEERAAASINSLAEGREEKAEEKVGGMRLGEGVTCTIKCMIAEADSRGENKTNFEEDEDKPQEEEDEEDGKNTAQELCWKSRATN